jgi:glycosyltransferase involved in cell wall biosynthesis
MVYMVNFIKFNPMKVSVFVPVKNAESTIKDCIDSILKQTHKIETIFVIDNISTDRTYDILKSFGNKIKLKRMVGTVPKMHNYVLKNTRTKYLAYTNADCVVDKKWLDNLLSGFTEDDIVATAGYCTTPKGLNKLQELIGRELENRFKRFPKYISRAPDMNLCVKTKIAKQVKFDERFFWSWETDFGYRLTKVGKMKYVPKAVVYHYHRPNWSAFFKQQMRNAMIVPLLYWKHLDKTKGDHVSTGSMALMLLSGYMTSFLLLLSFAAPRFCIFFLISLAYLIFLMLREISTLAENTEEKLILFRIYVTRLTAWMVGLPRGVLMFLKNRWYEAKR